MLFTRMTRIRVAEAWRQAHETKELYQVEYLFRIHDGSWRMILARGLPVLNPDGTIREWIGTCIDVTDLRRAERERVESEEQLRVMADAIPQLAWVAKADGYIYWYNQRWYEYTGMTPEQMGGGLAECSRPRYLAQCPGGMEAIHRYRETLRYGFPSTRGGW